MPRPNAGPVLLLQLSVAAALVVACQAGRKIGVEIINETLHSVTTVEAKIGRATVSAPDLAPGVQPGPSLRLAAQEESIPVNLTWRDGANDYAWTGRIDAATSHDVEIALIGPNLAVIRERNPGK